MAMIPRSSARQATDAGKTWRQDGGGELTVGSASVSGRGSVSDLRLAACVGGSGERDGRARSARGGQGGLSVPKPPCGVSGLRHAERSRPRPTLSASRVPHTNTLTPSHTQPATREPRAGPAGGPQFPDTLALKTDRHCADIEIMSIEMGTLKGFAPPFGSPPATASPLASLGLAMPSHDGAPPATRAREARGGRGGLSVPKSP